MALTTRAGKGTPLTNTEMDDNLTIFAASALDYVFDGNGSPLTAGMKFYLEVPWACNIVGWKLLGNAAGSAQVDVVSDTYAAYGADTSLVGGGTKPNLAAANKNTSAPAGWTGVAVPKDNSVGVILSSVSGLTRLTVSLKIRKT